MGDLGLMSKVGAPVIDRQLITYAFLAQTNPTQGDLLSGLAPIVKPIARELAGQPFDGKKFSQRVEELYQISIHPWVADDLAPRLEKAGLLVKTHITDRITSYTYADIPQEFDEVSEGDVRQVLLRFVEYARPLLSSHNLDLDDARLEEIFLRELTTLDFHSALLRRGRVTKPAETPRTSAQTLHMPTKTENMEQGSSVVAEQEALVLSNVTILCAGFILAMHQKEPKLYDLILRIATGAMVAEAVLNIQNPGVTTTLTGLRIILDGPFIMSLLDLDEKSATAYAEILCDQISKQGAQLQVFQHSVDEVRTAITSTLRACEDGNGKGALARRLAIHSHREYVKSVLQTLESTIRRRHITVVNSQTRREHYVHFSAEDETAMAEYLGHYENSLARERDAASVAEVMRLRGGKVARMGRLQQAGAIFVTSNARVANRANGFTISRKMREDQDVPPVLTDRQLASLLFVIFGGQGKELTQYQLLANCAKALEPNNGVIQNMHRFLSGLDSNQAEQFRAVMTVDRASQHLVQITLGEDCISSVQDATMILEQLEHQLSEDNRRQYDDRLAELITEHEAQKDAITRKNQEEVAELKAQYDEMVAKLAMIESARAQDQFERDAAIQSREELNKQIRYLNDVRRDETKGKLAACASYGYQRGELRHREFSWAVVLVLLLCTLLASGVIPDDYKVLFLIASFTSSCVGGAVFWRNPEKILSSHLASVRQTNYRARAQELGVNPDDPNFVINLEDGTVTLASQTEESTKD